MEEPGGPGHLTEMEGFSPIREGPLKSRGSALILGKRGSKPIKQKK